MKLTVIILFILLLINAYDLGAQDPQVEYQICTGCSSNPNGDGTVNNPGNQGQNYPFPYGNNVGYEAKDIASDFGPRWISSNNNPYAYDWHRGVDFNVFNVNDRGYSVVAIEDGDIFEIVAGGGYKYFMIDGVNDFGYGHIFHSDGIPQRSGAFVLTTLDGSQEYAIVNTQTNTAISAIPGTVTLNVNNTIVTYNTHTRVVAGQEIAASGGSSGTNYNNGSGFGPHIHLYRFRNISSVSPISTTNTIDPLTVVNYTAPHYFFEIHTMGEAPGNIVFEYPSGDEETILVHLWMDNATNAFGTSIGRGNSDRYASGTFDIDEVKLMIRKRNESVAAFRVIQGPNIEARLTLGGRINSQIYPSISLYSDGREGHWNRTGIDPYAYSSARGAAKDEHYFADIALRIHKNNTTTTNCPDDVRYPDGNYNIKAEATDVRNTSFSSSEIEVTIDNFQPFIQEVIATVDGKTIYNNNWTCAPCGIQLGQSSSNEMITYEELEAGIRLTVRSSEPVENLELSIPVWNIANISPEAPEADETFDGIHWRFIIPYDKIKEATQFEDLSFQFTGQDLSGNNLLTLNQAASSNNCVMLPTRNGPNPTDWDNPNGLPVDPMGDQSHTFSFECVDGGFTIGRPLASTNSESRSRQVNNDCIELSAEIVHATDANAEDGAITLTAEGGLGQLTYEWEDGETGASRQDLAVGSYTVTVSDDLCCQEEATLEIKDGCLTIEVDERP